jgi:hypothetical protein
MADQSTQPTRTHKYHAEATVLKGDLYHPLVQQIKPQTNVKLAEHGGYLSEHAEPYRLEGVISFEKAYTQTAGNPNPKSDGGWTTLVTSVVEQLSVLEVVTADRVVGQIATHHPAEGYVPSVHFLGTRFENLRIAGHPVKVDVIPDPYFLKKPENDGPYTQHPGFLERLKSHFERLSGSEGVPEGLVKRYNHLPVTSENEESIECSLVTNVEAPSFGRCFGHVIEIPDFGKIHLGLLKIKHSDYDKQKRAWKKTLFDLTMIELELGCIAGGIAAIANPIVNGQSSP